MKILNKKVVFSCIWLFMLPIIISSYNLRLRYKVSSLKKDIKLIATENQYLKKKFYANSTLAMVEKQAMAQGFEVPKPYTIVNIDFESPLSDKYKDKNLFAKINFFYRIFKNG